MSKRDFLSTQALGARELEDLLDLAARMKRPVAILGDLQGPKIRVGLLSETLLLRRGDTVTFAPEGEHVGDEIPTTYAGLAADLNPGDVVLLADGLMELVVLNVGLEVGVISPRLFAVMVLMALVTTFMTTPLVALLLRNRAEERATSAAPA